MQHGKSQGGLGRTVYVLWYCTLRARLQLANSRSTVVTPTRSHEYARGDQGDRSPEFIQRGNEKRYARATICPLSATTAAPTATTAASPSPTTVTDHRLRGCFRCSHAQSPLPTNSPRRRFLLLFHAPAANLVVRFVSSPPALFSVFVCSSSFLMHRLYIPPLVSPLPRVI